MSFLTRCKGKPHVDIHTYIYIYIYIYIYNRERERAIAGDFGNNQWHIHGDTTETIS